MIRLLPLWFVLPAILVAGFVHGRWTDRWTSSQGVATAVDRLTRVPLEIGDWHGRELKIDKETIEMAGIDGYVMRRYNSPRLGAISILLVCGRPGPIAAHTPEVCYGGAGYEATREPVEVRVDPNAANPTDTFFASTFAMPNAPDRVPLRLFWAWNGARTWEVSTNPRLGFAHYPCLYKLYIIRETFRTDGPEGDDCILDFSRSFLPVLRKILL